VPGSGVQDLSIRFRTAAGGEAAFTAHLREALGTPGAGATVPVAYDDADPGRARLDVGRPLDATALALACAALGALLAGLGLWVRGRSVGHHR
jgi:hypothetical protein